MTLSFSSFSARLAVAFACWLVSVSVTAGPQIAVTGPFAEWNPVGVKLTEEDGVHHGVVKLTKGSTTFKVTQDGAWDNNWGAGGGTIVVPGRTNMAANGDNIGLFVPNDGEYRFIIEIAGTPKATVIAAETEFTVASFKSGGLDFPKFKVVSIAGSFNQWLPGDNPLEFKGKSTWSGEVKLPEGLIEFKFPTNDNWENSPSFGGFQNDLFPPIEGTASNSMDNIKMYVPVAGSYRVSFNDDTLAFLITSGEGVELPADSDQKAVAFTMMHVPSSETNWGLLESTSMKVGEDGHTWSLTLKLKQGPFAFKVVGDKSWNMAWGQFHGDAMGLPAKGRGALNAPDIRVNVAVDGDHELTFNDITNEWSLTAKK